jgi:hypothetical protein
MKNFLDESFLQGTIQLFLKKQGGVSENKLLQMFEKYHTTLIILLSTA